MPIVITVEEPSTPVVIEHDEYPPEGVFGIVIRSGESRAPVGSVVIGASGGCAINLPPQGYVNFRWRELRVGERIIIEMT